MNCRGTGNGARRSCRVAGTAAAATSANSRASTDFNALPRARFVTVGVGGAGRVIDNVDGLHGHCEWRIAEIC